MKSRRKQRPANSDMALPSGGLCWAWLLGQVCIWSAASAMPVEAAEGSLGQYVTQGRQAYAKGDYAAAVEAFGKAQELAPESPEVGYNLGAALYKRGDLDEAKEQFLKALSIQQRGLEANAKFNLGNVCYGQALKKQSAIPEAIIPGRAVTDRDTPPCTRRLRKVSNPLAIRRAIWPCDTPITRPISA